MQRERERERERERVNVSMLGALFELLSIKNLMCFIAVS